MRALQVDSVSKYRKVAAEMDDFTRKNYDGDPYQQFFFNVRDDVGLPVTDFYIDFYAQLTDGSVHEKLTLEFDKAFEVDFYRHSADPSCRTLMMNLARLREYFKKLKAAKARLVFDVFAISPIKEVKYLPAFAVVFDHEAPDDGPTFLFENTTTLVQIILNRVASDQVLQLVNFDLKPLALPPTDASTSSSGRARLLGAPARRAGVEEPKP